VPQSGFYLEPVGSSGSQTVALGFSKKEHAHQQHDRSSR